MKCWLLLLLLLLLPAAVLPLCQVPRAACAAIAQMRLADS
jgi:hypothetical protein